MIGAPDCWQRHTSVLFTSFWGWTPDTWGTVGWTDDRGSARRSNLLAQLTDPFITVCYVTSNKSFGDSDLKGKIAGFYLVSHQTGDRDQFTHPIHHGREPAKWRHSLRALRAFSYLPEHRLSVSDLDPALLSRARSISSMCEILTDPECLRRLQTLPWEEVEVYRPISVQAPSDEEPTRGMVPGGPASSEGYVVADGSQLMPRELYILKLRGEIDAYLGRNADGRAIIKIGLSASPEMRRQDIQKAMPRGAFRWEIDRTTRSCGFPPCASHAVAILGEYAMKRHLAAHSEWLGGEYYLAHESEIDTAWQLACLAVK